MSRIIGFWIIIIVCGSCSPFSRKRGTRPSIHKPVKVLFGGKGYRIPSKKIVRACSNLS